MESPMKLTSNLNPKSVPGCYNGTLQLVFSAKNDWISNSGPGGWKAGTSYGSALMETYGLTPDVKVLVNLNPAPAPGVGGLMIQGAITVTVNDRQIVGTGRQLGEGSAILIPSQTPPKTIEMWGCYVGGVNNNVRLGFWLPIPWDGQAAVCHGLWWASW
jgi:hypothetical protein